ncbi:MAG: GNAT family N-acetyltransferase [Candidatus Hadarchaeaceae archaeon]
MKIRKVKPEEVSQIADLQQGLMLREKKIDPTYFDISKYAKKRFVEFAKKKIENRNSRLLVAIVDDKIVAYILGWVKERPPVLKLKTIGYISDCFVMKKFRRKGIGEKLVQRMLAWFKTKKLSHAELIVTSRNKLGLSVWKDLGFKEYRKIMRRKI